MAKNIAHSLKAKLLNQCNHENTRYQQLLVRYMQERFLYRLSESKYCFNFILKGGALLYAYDEFLPRPTLDVDFLGTHISNSKETIIQAFKEIASINTIDDGIRFDPESIDAHDIAIERKYPGMRITIIVFLDTIRKELSFDIGFGDVITPNPIIMEYPTVFDDMDKPKITAYSLETVVAEKFQTMVEKGVFNSRMKDFFDLYRMITAHKFNQNTLIDAIKATFINRDTDLSSAEIVFSPEFVNNITLENRWNAFCKKSKIEHLPPFKETMNVIIRFIKSCYNLK